MPEQDVLQNDNGIGSRPTAVRFRVLGTAFSVAFLLYLHRFMLTYAQQYIREDLRLSNADIGWCQFAFFITYAIAQVPSGWLSDRLGPRLMLSIYILVWSGFTVSMGWVGGLFGLLAVRGAVGLGQAGAYPTCALVVGRWSPFSVRAFVSSVIAFGGRVGGAVAPILVSLLIVAMVPPETPESSQLDPHDLLNASYLSEQLELSQVPLESGSDELKARQRAARAIYERMGSIDGLRSKEEQPQAASNVDSSDRKFGSKPEIDGQGLTSEQAATLCEKLNTVLLGDVLLQPDQAISLPVEREAKRLWDVKKELTPAQRARLNRLVIEAACPAGVRKVYADGWRPVMMLLGSLGLIAAVAWFFVVRNRPEEHSLVNQAELELISPGGKTISARSRAPFPWRTILTSPSLWNLSFSQWGNNLGWAFLVTLLPRYLQAVYQVPFEDRSFMASVPLWIGTLGMLSGGWATDWLTRMLGLRIGRSWPVGLTRIFGAAAFGGLLLHPSNPWMATALFAVVAFTTDFGAPAMWAYSQDVGGRNTAAILGWSNMWGNVGAAMSDPLLNRFLGESGDNWDAAFKVCAVAFLLAGIAGMFIDSTKKIDPGEESAA